MTRRWLWCRKFSTATKQATKSHYNAPSLYDIIIMRRKYGTASREQSCGAFLMPGKECLCMGYRKVSYIEQVWYIIKYKLGERFRRR